MIPLKRDMVDTFDALSSFQLGTAAERDPAAEYKNSFKHREIIPLWNINTATSTYKLAKPLKLNVYYEDDMWFVENESLVITGSATSKDEAIDDFNNMVVHFYNYYYALSNDKVIGEAARLKNIFSDLFLDQ